MKRHESLIPLTHDHHHALAQGRRLRLTATGTVDERVAQARLFLKFFYSDTLKHFREEEEIVFPLIQKASDMKGTLERATLEHLHIRALVHALEEEAEEGIVTEKTVLRVAAFLERHIRFEEKVVFPLIETVAASSDLEAICLSPRDRVAS